MCFNIYFFKIKKKSFCILTIIKKGRKKCPKENKKK